MGGERKKTGADVELALNSGWDWVAQALLPEYARLV